jgi:hypothetical protein
MVPSLRRTQFSPTWPGSPPASPKGRTRRWPDNIRALHPFEEADGAADAVAGAPFALAAGTGADVEILQYHRITEFEHFRVGEPRVGHVRMHGVGAVEAGTGRRARADRFVISLSA